MSHQFFVEALQEFTVAWALLIMVSARRWTPALTLLQLAAAVSFGLLVKLSTPLYLAGPGVVAL